MHHTARYFLAVISSAVLAIGLAGCSLAADSASSSSASDAAVARPTPTQSPAPFAVPTPAPPIIDLGERKHARGPASQLPNGEWKYTFVKGDVGGAVCDRFGRAVWQLRDADDKAGVDCRSMASIGEEVILDNSAQPGT